MGGIERMVFGLGPFEQVELDEPRHAIEIGIAAQPYFLESFFSTSLHTKPIHGNEHVFSPDCKGQIVVSYCYRIFQIEMPPIINSMRRSKLLALDCDG